MLPVESASIVVRKVPLNVTKEQIEHIFLKAGAIKYVYFPKVPRHFTTKYCFIKFHDFKRAREAQQLFDGYRLGDQWLQVVAYDPTYKFRQSCSSHGINGSFDGPPADRTKHPSSFASIAQTTRASSLQVGTPSSSPTRSRRSSPVSSLPCVPPPQLVLPSSTPSFLSQSPRFTDINREFNSNSDSQSDGINSDSENGEYVDCPVVDNILLDSEVGFWSWLEQRLRLVGPLHYKTCEIENVFTKLPFMARKQFAWPLGAFRLCDKERFQMIGPFICLPEQTTEAKAKCLAMCCNWRTPLTEFWEPLAPSEIRTSNQMIQHLHNLLLHFGPQSIDNIKIRQILQCLSPEMRSNGDFRLLTPSDFAEFLESPNAKKVFGVRGTIVYLNEEHMHILHFPNQQSIAGEVEKETELDVTE